MTRGRSLPAPAFGCQGRGRKTKVMLINQYVQDGREGGRRVVEQPETCHGLSFQPHRKGDLGGRLPTCTPVYAPAEGWFNLAACCRVYNGVRVAVHTQRFASGNADPRPGIA